ncbi:MAG: serine/threonine-protein phosphatase [Defluviitaleaceae bacterium]|nr:serine/threonine-protein phosphatase [Defluviitaleaceae bacterium]
MLEAAMQTCIGSRPSNQDRMFAKTEIISGKTCGLFCVADGMGGYSDGHIAAEMAVSHVTDMWANMWANRASSDTPDFSALFDAINREIITYARAQNETLGTTLSLLFICGKSYTIAHTGDSRIYLIRKKFFRRTSSVLTEDQTWASEKLREGKIPLAEIRANPNRNKLTGCLGIYSEPKIFTTSGRIKRGDTFILCTDGLYRAVDKKILITQKSPAESAEHLIKTVETHESRDNASVVVVRV